MNHIPRYGVEADLIVTGYDLQDCTASRKSEIAGIEMVPFLKL